MDCRNILIMLDDFLDDALLPREKRELEKHMDSCTKCAREAEDRRRILGMLDDMETAEAPAGFENAVMAKLAAVPAIRRPRVLARMPAALVPRKMWFSLPVLAAAAIVYSQAGRIWNTASETAGGIVIWFSNLLVNISGYMHEFRAAYRLVEVIKRDMRFIGTIMKTISPMIVSTGENVILPGAGLLIIAVLLFGLFLKYSKKLQKRRPHNALFIV